MMRAYSMLAAGAVAMAMMAVLPACQTVTGKVPSTAMEVSAGRGNVTYRAADDGRVFVYNQNTGDMVYSGELRRGELLLLDTNGDRVLVDNRPVVERVNLDGGHRFQIFLDPRDRTVRRFDSRTTTVVERRPALERREVVVPRTTYERREVVVPKTTYERREVVVPSDRTVERRTYVGPDGRTVIEREVRDR